MPFPKRFESIHNRIHEFVGTVLSIFFFLGLAIAVDDLGEVLVPRLFPDLDLTYFLCFVYKIRNKISIKKS